METLYEGKFLKFVKEGKWEWVQRNNCTGVVIIIPLLDGNKTIFVEQYRPPVGRKLIEFPAGLAGDLGDEDFSEAVKREMHEETGYTPDTVTHLTRGPASAGLSDETLDFYLASDLRKTGKGGGDESEDIDVHIVELDQIEDWLKAREDEGTMLDVKVHAGLYFLNRYRK